MTKTKSSKIKKLLLLPCIFMLSGCRGYFQMEHITGEYQYEDSIYLKCSGTYHYDDKQSPVGWLKLNDVVYNCTIVAQLIGTYSFKDSDKVLELKNDQIMEASLELSFGDIVMKIITDYTGTYEKGDSFLLKKTYTNKQ